MVFILGKSGSGKSTLLNLLGGLDQPTSGEIIVEGRSLKKYKAADYDDYRNQYIGFIFQEYNLLKDLNVRENIELALRISKDAGAEEKIERALQAVGLNADYKERKVDELLGGEKQRMAIARAVVKNSKLILADEPTGNLDSRTGAAIWEILKNLSKEQLVVVVSHDRESAQQYGDRIIEIADGSIISDNSSRQISDSRENKAYTPMQKRNFPADYVFGWECAIWDSERSNPSV